MLGQQTIRLDMAFRLCRESDLCELGWFGLYTRYHKFFSEQFERQVKGDNLILVAEANGFPVGRLCVDLVKGQKDSIGVLWAFAVFPPLQNLGIGTRLMIAAEDVLSGKGYRVAEIGAGKDNPRARRLYERLGYRVVRDNVEEWDVTTPEGTLLHEVSDEWIMQKPLAGTCTAGPAAVSQTA